MTARDDFLTLALERSPLRSLPFDVWHGPLDLERALAGRHRAVAAAEVATSAVPPSTVYAVELHDEGLVVWAVQRALNAVMKARLVLDGRCGRRTAAAIEDFQEEERLVVDGVFGPASSAAMAAELENLVTAAIPDGLLYGQIRGESGALIGAVNWTVPGGVDCSYTQRRVLSDDFGDEAVEERAFNGRYQTSLSGRSLREAFDRYLGEPGADTLEAAWRCAALRHNYPAGAEAVAFGRLTDYYRSPQDWVERIGVAFRDGAAVETPLEWMQFYALGAPEHETEGLVTRYVSSWTVG